MTALQIKTIEVWSDLEKFLEPLLRNLDPALFQNIILGILAIFIPFAIVFLTDVLDSEKQRSDFEKMVLNEEVLGTKKVFGFSVGGIAVLAFFAGTDVSILAKSFAIFFSIVILFLLWRPLWKILRFSDGKQSEFEIRFLKGLNFSKIFRFRNKSKVEKIIKVWNSIWSGKSQHSEQEFTKIFVTHIDNAVRSKRYGLAVSLASAYEKNLDAKSGFLLGSEILPKLFQWNEKFWIAEQKWLNRNRKSGMLKKSISKFPLTVQTKILTILKQEHTTDGFFLDWRYFQNKFISKVIKILLCGGMDTQYRLFTCFKNYIDGVEENLENSNRNNENDRWWKYIEHLFESFCLVIFENIHTIPNKHGIWRHDFPPEWKITIGNSKKHVSRIILHQFLQWTSPRALERTDYDHELVTVINGIFPNAHPQLFQAFLMLYFNADIKDAIQKKPNFSLKDIHVSWVGEKSDEDIEQMIHQKEQQKQKETMDMIFDYFGQYWEPLKCYQEDFSQEENENWLEYSVIQRKTIIDRVRKRKLQEVLDELNSKPIKDLCVDSQQRKRQRGYFIQLIGLLLERIS